MDKLLILSKIIEYKKFKSDAEFARFLGITPQNLSKWKTRGTYDIELLYTKCPELSAEWLLSGKGEMLKNESISQKTSNSNNSLNSNIGTVKGNVAISHNDISNLIELQKGSQEERKEFNQRLKTSQEQLNTSQEQINTLLEILKTK